MAIDYYNTLPNLRTSIRDKETITLDSLQNIRFQIPFDSPEKQS